MRRPVCVKVNLLGTGPPVERHGRPPGGAGVWRERETELPFPHLSEGFSWSGEGSAVQTAPVFGAPKGSLDSGSLPAENRSAGNGSGTYDGTAPVRDPVGRFSA